jgi:hypothetical protein
MKKTLATIAAALISANVQAGTVPETTVSTANQGSASTQGYKQLLKQGEEAYHKLSKEYSENQTAIDYQHQIAELKEGVEFLKTAEQALEPVDNSVLYSQLFELEPLDSLEELLEGGPREQLKFEFRTTDISELQKDIETLEAYVNDNLLTCATHAKNMENYNTIAAMVNTYRETLASQGVSLSDFDISEIFFIASQTDALKALREYPVNCDSQADKGAVQEDRVLTIPRVVFDNLYEPEERVPIQYQTTPVIEQRIEENAPQQEQTQISEPNKPLVCQFVEQGYIPRSQIGDKCSEGTFPGLPEFAKIPYSTGLVPRATQVTYQVLDCKTRAKLLVEINTGWIIGTPQFPNNKDACNGE